MVVQVSNHCKNSIKETDAARKIMPIQGKSRLPFRINNSLMCLSERKPKKIKKGIKRNQIDGQG